RYATPSEGRIRPARQRSNVVLPQPDGPTTHNVSFGWMARSRFSNATTEPSRNVRVARSRRILAGVGGRGLGVGEEASTYPQSVPAWISRPGAAVAFDGFLDNRLLDNLLVRRFVVGLDDANVNLFANRVLDQLLWHAVVHAPDTAAHQIVVCFVDFFGLAFGLIDGNFLFFGAICVHDVLRFDHSGHDPHQRLTLLPSHIVGDYERGGPHAGHDFPHLGQHVEVFVRRKGGVVLVDVQDRRISLTLNHRGHAVGSGDVDELDVVGRDARTL